MRNKSLVQRNIIIFDCVVAALAPVAAVYLRGLLEARFDFTYGMIPYAATSALATIVLLWWLGVSRALWSYFAISDAVKAVQAIALGIGIGAIVAFADDRLESVARSVPFLQLAFQAGLFVAVRQAAQKFLSEAYEKPARPGGVLVIGCNRAAEAYIRAVELMSKGTLEVAGVVCEEKGLVGLTLRGKPVLGTPDQLDDVLNTLKVHGIEIQRIVVAVPTSTMALPEYAGLTECLRRTCISIIQVDSLFGEATAASSSQEAMHPANRQALGSYAILKSAVDVLGSSMLILLTSPLFALVAFLTLLDVGRPLYFWQQRMGMRAKVITVFKFRTMRAPVDETGRVLTDAERTSAIGRFSRSTRLDELPQLVQIFKGEMSFVGPRPLLPVDQPEDILGRLAVRPGLTGWAQVNGGKLVTPEDKGALDLYYVAHANLWMDIKIAWMTVLMFARGDKLNRKAILQARYWLENQKISLTNPKKQLKSDDATHSGDLVPIARSAHKKEGFPVK